MPKLQSILTVISLSLMGAAYAGCSSSDTSTSSGGTTDGGSEGGGGSDGASTPADSGSTPADSGGTTGDGGKKAFGEDCNVDGDCETGACFAGNKQHFCTFHCMAATAATDCPKPPTTGECNNQGYCRAP